METIVQGGNSQNPYKQFTYAIQPQQSETIFYALNYFRVLDLTGDPANMRIRFGSSGSFSEFVGAGIGFEMPQAVERVDITNTSTTDVLTVTIAVAIGRIDDNRLNVSGNVNVQNTITTPLFTSGICNASNFGQVSVDNTATLILASNASRRAMTVAAGTSDLYIGNANTLTTTSGSILVPAGGAMDIFHKGDVYGIRTGSAANAMYYEGTI